MASTIIDNSLTDDNSRTLVPAAVGSQVLLMSVVSVATILLFNILRPNNKIIYEPKVKYHEGDKPPPRISDSLCGWLPPLLHTKEPELLEKIGLDAVAFLRFLRLLRWLFTGITALACGVLIPINVYFNLTHVKSSKRDILSMLTVRDVGGNFLIAHVVVAYAITVFIIISVNLHWKAMLKLRHTWFRSPEYLQSFYARTLQVRRVPKKLQSDEGLTAIFQSVKVPYPTTSVHIGRKVGKLPELIEYHNQTVREFEEILVKYLKGGKIKAKRPTIRVGGTCGCGGMKKDAIDFYTAKLKRTEAAIEEYRTEIDSRKAENYGFASMAAVPYAHVVAKMIEGKHPKGTDIDLAPNPKDIIWSNMNNSDGELARKRLLGFAWLFAVCFFNTVPLFIISVLANLDALRAYVGFLQSWFEASQTTFAIVSGVLPPSISGIFGFVLPIIMRWLTKYMGALTHSKLDRAVVARYFTFLIISQLIIFTLLGIIFGSVQQIILQIGKKASFGEIIDSLHELPQRIHITYINQASYWLTYFPLRGFLAIFDLAQIINLVWLSFKTHVFGRTPRDIREWTKPPDFQYAIYYSNLLFMCAVGLVFAPLAPLVALAACIVFWMNSWVYKYQLMFVYVTKVESGGRIWNVIINRLLVCVVLMQLLMLLTIGLRYEFSSFIWTSLLPPIIMVICFKLYINRTYVPYFHYFMPTEEEINIAKVHSERADAKANRLEKRFGHPALHAELFTPMLHKEMMPLLSQVYQGKIGKDKAKLDEYGGQRMDAQVVPGGIKIAAIDQNDLAYDPALYRRDRGELDWDARSIASTAVFSDNGHHYAGSMSKPAGYDNYLSKGPRLGMSEMELGPMDSMAEPLLSPRSMALHNQAFASQQSLTPSLPSSISHASFREAPLHRPQDMGYSPSPSYVSTENLNQGPSATSPYPVTPASEQSHASYFTQERQSTANLLGGQIGSPSPGPQAAMGYPPQPHNRQASGDMLSGSSVYQNQMQQQQQQAQHARQTSGNILGGGQPRTASPGPYQAFGGPSARSPSPGVQQAYAPQQQQHARQMSGNPLSSARSPSPGPYQAYAPQQQQQHARQGSSNMLNRTPSPGPYQAYSPPPQEHARQGSGNVLGDYQLAPSSSQGYVQPPPGLRSPPAQYPPQQRPDSRQGGGPVNMAGRGAHRS
ncbi:hypothetical protein D9613_000857 [Agrocybe pediades]|uniref:DUF221-domain-containing protein n=1 Tax=Agrocybe pediades TaxID=84607 RepID=A0A8H4R0Y3_9AGAR|nr:hypothetical protein D9613_000857 [Agrocybe pediades]